MTGPIDLNSKCALSQSVTVDVDYPCDVATTSERELCAQPTALIQAPTQIDSCPGTGLTLDASRSSGGGVRRLTYSWSAPPRSCDNYYAVAAKLASSPPSASSVQLTALELDGGRAFDLMLVVTNFLGCALSHLALPTYSWRIHAHPLPRTSAD